MRSTIKKKGKLSEKKRKVKRLHALLMEIFGGKSASCNEENKNTEYAVS